MHRECLTVHDDPIKFVQRGYKTRYSIEAFIIDQRDRCPRLPLSCPTRDLAALATRPTDLYIPEAGHDARGAAI